MTNNFHAQVAYWLVRGDPRLEQYHDYPFIWVPSIMVAMQQVAPAVQRRVDGETHQRIGPATDELYFLLWNNDILRR